MGQSKHTFVASKMNKDLDARLMKAGEYRDAENVSVNKSESEDVGALENITGNESQAIIEFLDFTTADILDEGIKVIGHYVDVQNDRIFAFVTNFMDSSSDHLSNRPLDRYWLPPKRDSGGCMIIMWQRNNPNTFTTLVKGAFLNFSQSHPITGVNILEDLLFWTDNRNQPRVINLNSAIGDENYYKVEDNISVAKYYPWEVMDLYTSPGADQAVSTMADKTSEWLPMVAKYEIESITINNYLTGLEQTVIVFKDFTGFNWYNASYLTNNILGISSPPCVKEGTYYRNDGGGNTIVSVQNNTPAPGQVTVTIEGISPLCYPIPDPCAATCPVYTCPAVSEQKYHIEFFLLNPDFEEIGWQGDKYFLEDKFARFSYRFKFDDNQYSLMAPFTQIAFIPEQNGYFMEDDDTEDGTDESSTKESTVVSFMRNMVDQIGLRINLPNQRDELFENLHVTEIEILFRQADSANVQAIGSITQEEIEGSNPTDTFIDYIYSGKNPYKVIPETEITRVYDKTPVKALAQEIVGNRVVYGNFVDKHTSLESLDYYITYSNKLGLSDSSSVGYYLNSVNPNRVQYPNHTLKQNRIYQAGIVLSDKFGRQSDVILSSRDVNTGTLTTGSTLLFPWSRTSNVIDAGYGFSMLFMLDELIPNFTNQPGYPGLYDEISNPLGWYSYKIVVKQQEQEYYNAYVPGLSSVISSEIEVDALYNPVGFLSQAALYNDNINKIPIDPNENSDIFFPTATSENPLWCTVTNSNEGEDDFPTLIPALFKDEEEVNYSNTPTSLGTEVTEIKPRKSFEPDEQNTSWNFYGAWDPVASTDVANPNIASLYTRHQTLGYTNSHNGGLSVLETKPNYSNLDIYWETSSSGLISELNEAVAGAPDPLPYGLTPFSNFWKEDVEIGDEITGVFNFADSAGNPLSTGATLANIVSIWDPNTGTTYNTSLALSANDGAGGFTMSTLVDDWFYDVNGLLLLVQVNVQIDPAQPAVPLIFTLNLRNEEPNIDYFRFTWSGLYDPWSAYYGTYYGKVGTGFPDQFGVNFDITSGFCPPNPGGIPCTGSEPYFFYKATSLPVAAVNEPGTVGGSNIDCKIITLQKNATQDRSIMDLRFGTTGLFQNIEFVRNPYFGLKHFWNYDFISSSSQHIGQFFNGSFENIGDNTTVDFEIDKVELYHFDRFDTYSYNSGSKNVNGNYVPATWESEAVPLNVRTRYAIPTIDDVTSQNYFEFTRTGNTLTRLVVKPSCPTNHLALFYNSPKISGVPPQIFGVNQGSLFPVCCADNGYSAGGAAQMFSEYYMSPTTGRSEDEGYVKGTEPGDTFSVNAKELGNSATPASYYKITFKYKDNGGMYGEVLDELDPLNPWPTPPPASYGTEHIVYVHVYE